MRDICKIALRLTILMVIAGLCLGAAYTVTKDPIARQEAEWPEKPCWKSPSPLKKCS